jgi:hypothetical protein
MQKWEYRIVVEDSRTLRQAMRELDESKKPRSTSQSLLGDDFEKKLHHIEDDHKMLENYGQMLNANGEDGWELVGMNERQTQAGDYHSFFYFKRPKQ